MRDIVLSKLLLRVLGLVIVVPRLACLEWPRLTPPMAGLPETGDGEPVPGPTVEEVLIRERGGVPEAIACSNPAETPSAFKGAEAVSPGVVGWEPIKALPSSESASKSSGGSLSFSISDLRLFQRWCQSIGRPARRTPDVRILEAIDCVLDSLGTGCQSTVGQLG